MNDYFYTAINRIAAEIGELGNRQMEEARRSIFRSQKSAYERAASLYRLSTSLYDIAGELKRQEKLLEEAKKECQYQCSFLYGYEPTPIEQVPLTKGKRKV